MTNDSSASLTTLLPGFLVREPSVTRHQDVLYALVEAPEGQRQLAIVTADASSRLADFDGSVAVSGEQTVLLCPLNARNAAALRTHLAWLRPTVQGLQTGVGLGDRLGLATPGHLRAVKAVGGHLAPFPAQQSIREMSRTGRTPQGVMDDAMWGVFEEGWRTGFGADADHLKTPEDIDSCLAVGYTFYTFDPGAYVDASADHASPDELRAQLEALPWKQLEDTQVSMRRHYLSGPVRCEEHIIRFDEVSLARAAVKYGRAIAHVKLLYRHLEKVSAGRPWEVEVSVDETETPTTHAEHVYIATELRRLGVNCVSLAPRFVGQFEKGVDYIGPLDAFEADIAVHAAIARTLGPYKISLHSGSDKFSVYEPSARLTRGVVHLKTAGTSYLEALRTISILEPDLLRSIYIFAREHYEVDRATYHVSARLDRAPDPASLSDAELPMLLEQFDAREILHVTFGTVLTTRTAAGNWLFYDEIMKQLRTHPEAYNEIVKTHFVRHLRAFAQWSTSL